MSLSVPTKVLFFSSIALLLSGIMQLGTAWLNYKIRQADSLILISARYRTDIADQYTWLDDDFPNTLPLDVPLAKLIIENSRHYALNSPNSDAEYLSLYPGQLGFLRLGPHRRFFGIAMYHQLHCLDSLRQSIIHGPDWEHHSPGNKKSEQVPHVDHCLNYLRQTILCSADMTLEPEIVLGSGDVGEGLAVTHVCNDWSAIDEFAGKNWEEWLGWYARNLTGTL